MLGFLLFLVLGVLSYRLVLNDPYTRRYRTPCVASLTLHQLAAFSNQFAVQLPGTGSDSRVFLREAANGVNWNELIGTGANFYKNFLASIFSVTGRSDLAAFETSILAHALVLLVVARLLANLKMTTATPAVVWLIALSPSVLSYTSTTLREPWQQLFLCLAMLFIMQLKDKLTVKRFIGAILSLVLLGCLQKGLFVYAGAIFFLSLQFVLTRDSKGSHPGAGILALIVVLFLGSFSLTLISDTETSSETVNALAGGEILDYAAEYRGNADVDRATYGGDIDTSSVGGLLISVPRLIFLYLFSPLPWQLTDPKDMIAIVEIWVRAGLAVTGLMALPRQDQITRKKLTFLWFAWIILESLWAIGTSNWGTAARHRTVGHPLLCVFASPVLGGGKDADDEAPTSPQTVTTKMSKRQQIRALRQRARDQEAGSIKPPSRTGRR